MAQHFFDGPTLFEWPKNVWMAQNCLDGQRLFGLPNILRHQMCIRLCWACLAIKIKMLGQKSLGKSFGLERTKRNDTIVILAYLAILGNCL